MHCKSKSDSSPEKVILTVKGISDKSSNEEIKREIEFPSVSLNLRLSIEK